MFVSRDSATLDLKMRVPPHIAQRLMMASVTAEQHRPPAAAARASPPSPEPAPAAAAAAAEEGCALLQVVGRQYAGFACCACTLALLFASDWEDSSAAGSSVQPPQHSIRSAACLHLGLAPLTMTGMLTFNVRHKRARFATVGLAIAGCLFGNAGAVGLCMTGSSGSGSRALLSCGMCLGSMQLLMLMPKHNVPAVMVCTACTVIVCVLSCAAPCLASVRIAGLCYQSAVTPVLWLFWNARLSTSSASVAQQQQQQQQHHHQQQQQAAALTAKL